MKEPEIVYICDGYAFSDKDDDEEDLVPFIEMSAYDYLAEQYTTLLKAYTKQANEIKKLSDPWSCPRCGVIDET